MRRLINFGFAFFVLLSLAGNSAWPGTLPQGFSENGPTSASQANNPDSHRVSGVKATGTFAFQPIGDVAFGSAPISLVATAPPGETVSFSSSTAAVCTVSGSLVTLVSTGVCSIAAKPVGPDSPPALNLVQNFSVTMGSQTINFAAPNDVIFGSGQVSLTATASSGLPVAFVSTIPAVCTVAGNVVTLVKPGTCSITAKQAGNSNYSAAPDVVRSFSVLQSSQTITFDAIHDRIFGVPPFAVFAHASSGLPVGITSTTHSVCETASTMVMLLNVGNCSLTASQTGNVDYSPAPPMVRSFAVRHANPSGTFLQFGGSPFGVGPAPIAVVTGDFNGDGVPDLAAANANGNSVTVLLGNGSGGFTAAAGSPFLVGSGPNSIAVADFNGDGKPDLVTADANSNSLTVLLGDGLGGFTAAPGNPFAAGPGASSVTVGDFDRDGIPDIAAANSPIGSVTILLGNGRGAFSTDPGSPFPLGTQPQSLVAGDFDGDGNLDLASANFGSNNVTVLLGNGLGGFSAAPGSPLSVGLGPRAVRVGDFNGDGIQDLVTANGTSNDVSVMLGTGSGGFAAAPGSPFAASGSTSSVVISDFNGDGFQDIAASSGTAGKITFLLGNGSGGFSVANSPFSISNNPVSLAAEDLNGDGIEDLVTANYQGNSLSVLLGGLAPTSLALSTTTPSTIIPGQPVTLSIAVSPTAGAFSVPAGAVTISDGGTILGVATQSGGSYSFTTSGLSQGAHSFSASYAGDTHTLGSLSNAIQIQVSVNPQTISFAPVVDIMLSAGSVPLVATASSGLVVTFTSNTLSVCSVNNSNAVAIAPGLCSITANQAGSAAFAPAPPVTQIFTINKNTQTITFAPLPDVSLSASPLTLVATASSGLPVTFAATPPSSCSVSGNIVTLVTVGLCSITANQAGNANFAAAAPVTQNFRVNKNTQTITFAALPDVSLSASPLTVAATATSGLGVTFAASTSSVCTINGSTVTLVTTGLCSITANQAGNANYLAATAVTQSFNVNKNTQTITFAALPDVSLSASPLTVAATATSGLGVTFAASTSSVCTINGSTVTLVATGLCSIAANQPGNANYLAATAITQSFNVNKNTQTITFAALPDVTLSASPLTLAATASSGLAVTFASSSSNVCTVNGNAVTLVTAGTCSITANQAGNANYSAATAVTQSFTVTKNKQTITFGTLPDVTLGAAPFNLTATASSALAVAFASTTPTICTVSGLSVSVVAAGTCSITASQPGNAVFDAAANVVQSFAVKLTPQTITFNPLADVILSAGPVTLVATASSGLSVTFASTTPSVCTVSGNNATLVTTGLCSITANQAGNASFSPATAVTQSFTINKSTQTITFAPLPDVTLGAGAFSLTATASSGLAVTFASSTPTICTVSGVSVSAGAAGTCSITANQPGNTSFAAAASVTQSFAVKLGPQTITFGALSNVSVNAPPFSLSATSSAGLPVSFTSNTTSVCTVSGNLVIVASAGFCSITASQDGTSVIGPAATVTQNFTVTAPIAISTTSLAVGVVGQSYGPVNLAVTGASGGVTWTLVGSLPAGMSLSSGGSLGGTPTTSGSYPFSVKVTDGSGASAVLGLSLQINPALTVTTKTLSNAVKGIAYNRTLVAAGGTGNYSWNVSGGDLPSGITLSTAGALSGTPTVAGAFSFTARVFDGVSAATQALSLQVGSTLTITSSSALPNGAAGKAYSTTLVAAGGNGATYVWSVSSGTMPSGITLTPAGVLTGNPSVAGSFGFTVHVTDGTSPPADLAVTLTIYPALTVTTNFLPDGTAGQPYSPVTLAASGGSGSVTWTASGLPSALSLSAGGVLTGTPAAAGVSTPVFTATDPASGQSLNRSLTLTVTPATTALKLSPSNLVLGAAVNGAIAGSFTVSNATGAVTFSATGLPAGITLSATGAVSGSSAVAGNFPATIKVTDSTSATATAQLTVQILGLTTPSLPPAAATAQYSEVFAVAGGTPPYVFSASGMPAGFTISGSGTLSGKAATPGTLSFHIQVSDSSGLSTATDYSLTVRQAPVSINAPSLPDATAGTPYSQTLSATGGSSPYTWSILSGTPPGGLALSPAGTISGNPTTPGTGSFAVQATDASGGVASASVTININPTPITISSGSLPSGAVGFDYPQQILGASGGTAPYTFSISSGALPPGVSLTNGVISGKPTASDTFPFTLAVADSASNHATASLSINVRPATSDLALLAGSVSFSLNVGASGLPSAQPVGVQATIIGEPVSYSVSTGGTTWLDAGTGGTTPGVLNVALTTAALSLAQGNYTGTVTVTCTSTQCQGKTQTVAVSLAVTSPPPQLNVVNSLLSFTASSTSAGAQTQILEIQNVGGGSLGINSISCDAPWCTVSSIPASIASGPGAQIKITADPSTLSGGFFLSGVDITTSAGSIEVPITFFISQSVSLNLAPSGTQITMPAGGSPGNPNGSFLVSVAGGTVSWNASILSGPKWLVLNTTNGTATDGQPGNVSFSINSSAATLAPQAYYATIEVTSTGAVNSPQDFQVILNVTPPTDSAKPDPQPAGLLFITTVGGAPPPQIVKVYTSSGTPINYQAATSTDTGSWLSVAPPLGTTSSAAADSSTVSVNTAGLGQGVYHGGVTYAFSAAAVRTVSVTLIVQSAGGGAARPAPHWPHSECRVSTRFMLAHSAGSYPDRTGREFLRASLLADAAGDNAGQRLRKSRCRRSGSCDLQQWRSSSGSFPG